MKFLLALFMCIALLFGKDTSPSILILNEYDSSIGEIQLSEYFPNKNFIDGEDTSPFLSSLDSMYNPASGRMSLIRSMGEDFDVDYVLFHQIINDSSRFMLEGQMFNTKSGGLIHRRIVDITNYYKGQMNELKLWIGDVFKEIDKDWIDYRKLILFNDPEDIVQDKTPQGAMARSFMVPGWGQFYSDEYNAGVMFSGLEATLLSTVLLSYLSYNKSVKGLKKYTKLYEESSEQIEFDEYKSRAESEWDKHKIYNSAMIYAGITAGSIWVVNGIHAYIVGPRPKKDIIQKWDITSPNSN
ncbi:MAG: hypothetical protein CMG70_05965 [Candidatus Marinimicrobia bacterium]|nr:hypothetical protein [Candidatus Neomarinimicrobiota bacterium]|tara:strand:- start:508 stop:1401 length:894 start_codon:yes stop_codon:yes gene_type:complete